MSLGVYWCCFPKVLLDEAMLLPSRKILSGNLQQSVPFCLVLIGIVACSDGQESAMAAPTVPTQKQMADCAVADADDPPVVGSYWPPGTFTAQPQFGQENMPDDFVRNWYSTQLCAMGKAPLAPPRDETVRVMY